MSPHPICGLIIFYFPFFLSRYFLVVNDGLFSQLAQLLTESLENLITQLTPFSIIKVKKYTQVIKIHTRITELEIITPGHQVGVQLGNPCFLNGVLEPMEAKLAALRL